MLKVLCLLLWKNYVIVKRAWFWLCICFVCEIAWSVLIHRHIWKQYKTIRHPPIPLELESISERPIHILYSPSTGFTDTLLKRVSNGVGKGVVQIHSYENFQKMFYAIYNQPMRGYVVGINFTHAESVSNDLPKTLSYQIWEAFNVSSVHLLNEKTVRNRVELSNCKKVICIQGAIDKSFIDQAAKDNKYRFLGTSMPISVHDTCLQDVLDDVDFTLVQRNAALSLLTFFIVILVSREKDAGGQKLMIISGIPSWSNWTSWLITSFIIELIPCMVMTIMIYVIYFDTKASVILIYLLVTMYCLASKCAYFFIISFILQQDFAKLMCCILWLAAHWPLFLRKADFTFKFLTSFLPQMAVIWGYVELEELDERTCAGKVKSEENWSLSAAIIFLTVDSIMYIFLAWFTDVFCNGCFGRELPIRQLKKVSSQTATVLKQTTIKSSVIEPVVIAIKHIIHRYRKIRRGDILTRLALTDINMDILKNEVIFILGSDEDGRSTLVSTIIGSLNPTSGSVTVNGMNPRYLWKIGCYVGICLEKPLFFCDLSPKENLMFFSTFRGMSSEDAILEANMIMQKLNIKNTGYEHSKAMHKRICIGMALVGSPPILILDEPTAGLAADASKDVLKAVDLISHKHTVIITSKKKHEADYLADRIAFLHQGRIQAYGTNLWLKQQFGSGYHLSLKRDNSNNTEAITEVVQNFVSEAKIIKHYDMHLTYNIPYERRNEIIAIINAIEEKETELGVLSIYIDLTSLDEIFKTSSPTYSLNYSFGHTRVEDKLSEKSKIIRNQIKALIGKKFLYTYRFVQKWKFLGLTTFFAQVGGFIFFSKKIHSFDKDEFSIMKYRDILGAYLIKGDIPLSLVESYKNALTKITEKHYQVFNQADMYDLEIGAEMTENEGILELIAVYGPWVGDMCWKSVNTLTNAALHSINPQFNIVMERRIFDIFLIHDKIIEALFFSCFGFVVILAYFPLLPMVEIQAKTKRMQWLSGITDVMYWSVCYFIDFIYYTAFACGVVGMIAYVNADIDACDLLAVSVLLFTFGIFAIPVTYLHVFIFHSYVQVVTAIVIQCTVCLIVNLSFTEYVNALIMKFLGCYPFFGLIASVLKLYLQMSENMCVRIRKTTDCSKSENPCCSFPCVNNDCYTVKPYFAFSSKKNPHAIGGALLSFSVGTIFVTILVIVIDFNMFKKLLYRIARKFLFKEDQSIVEDSEVCIEKELAHELSCQKFNTRYLLTMDNVTKIYREGSFSAGYIAAVGTVCLVVKRGDFFAVTGCNDAGKTILVNMIVGEEFPSFGRLRIFSNSVGYCPQHVQLLSLLTAYENLMFFAMIRGLSKSNQYCEVDSMLKYFGLWESRSKFATDLNNTETNKLGVAAAVIGDPEFIVMDISTTGLDSSIRQNILVTVRQIQKPWQAVIATSELLEEREGIYTRFVVMANGKFLPKANWERIQEENDFGLILRIYINISPYDEVQKHLLMKAIEKKFENKLELKLQKKCFLLYHLADRAVKISTLVKGIMDLREQFVEVEDFSIQKACILCKVFDK